jgi:hypothetical protein
MEPNSFGKKLGIGLRVAGNIARDRAQEAKRSQVAAPTATILPTINPKEIGRKAEEVAARGRQLGEGIGRGSRQFSNSFFKPFAQASGVLWLEITGCFFALFALYFVQNVYQLRAQYAAGPQHRTFLLYCFLAAVFLYFSSSSFIKARRKSRKAALGK